MWNENHNQRKITKMITWITALSNPMKLWAMPCRATQDGWVMMESSDKIWSTGERNGKFSSVAHLCPTLCKPIDWSTPGFSVYHQLLELAQTHVPRVSDVIQSSHPLFPPVPPSVSLSHQEGSVSLFSFFIRGQTEWKPQSQTTNQSDHMDHSFI